MNNSILVVDDYEPWRRRVAAELEKSGRWRVAGECTDGDTAVREAWALRPGLIILDIGLKTVNGIEAARRIMADNPAARILFLTGQQSPDVADAALSLGARGYLLKTDAGGALLRAIEAVAAGARFVSPSLPSDVVDADRPPVNGHRHDAVFHADEAALVDDYARFAEIALRRNQPVLVVAPRGTLDTIHERLESRNVPLAREIDRGRYAALDIEAAWSDLLPGGRYDRERFRESAASLVMELARTAESGWRPAVCGEVAPRLWRDGRGDVAIDVERIWDETVTAIGADLLCGYCVDAARLADGEYSVFREICGAHGTVHVR